MQEKAKQPSSESHYRVAVDLTSQTIAQRARNFRNLVIAVVVVCCSCIVWISLARTLAPFAMLFSLLPAIGIFFFLDARLVDDWRSCITEAWVRGDVAFHAFVVAISANPILPKATLQGMLSTLPEEGKAAPQSTSSTRTREAVAEVSVSVNAYRTDILALWAVGYVIAATSLIVSVVMWFWLPLLGVSLVLTLPLIKTALLRHRLSAARQRIGAIAQTNDFDPVRYAEMAATIDWNQVPTRERVFFSVT